MLDLEEFETEVIALAGVRKVRTQEGVKFYGLPLGSPITADLIALKEKQASAKGITPPKNSLTSASSRVTPKAPTAPGTAAPEQPAASGLKAKKPTISGPAKFKVGDKEYGAPSGSKVIRSKKNPNVAYVRTPDGTIRTFNDQGEVEVPAALANLLNKKFTADFQGDDAYEVEDLTSAADDPDSPVIGSAADSPAETIAVSTSGEPVFTKNDQGGWTHDALGVEFSDEDVQTLVDNGEILLSPPPEGDAAEAAALEDQVTADFPDLEHMDKEEARAALEAMPVGTILGIRDTDSTFTKQDDGKWIGKSEASPNGTGKAANSGSLTLFRHVLEPRDKEFSLSDVSDDENSTPENAPEGDAPASSDEPQVGPEDDLNKTLDEAATGTIEEYLNSLPADSVLADIEIDGETAVKNPDGSWSLLSAGEDPAGAVRLKSLSIFGTGDNWMIQEIGDGEANPFPKEAPVGKGAAKAPIKKPVVPAKQAGGSTPKTSESSTVGVGSPATLEWANSAPEGASIEYTRPNGNKNTLTMTDGEWTSKSGIAFNDETVVNLINNPNAKATIKSDGSTPAAKPNIITPPYPPNDIEPIGKKSIKILAENESQAKQTIAEAAAALPKTGDTPLGKLDLSDPDWATKASPSEVVHAKDGSGVYVKKVNGNWHLFNGDTAEAVGESSSKWMQTKAEVQIEKPEKAGSLTESVKFEAGKDVTVTSESDFDALPVSGVLEYKGQPYTKVDAANNFLNSLGSISPANWLASGNKPMTYKVVSLPEAAPKKSTDYVAGDKIQKYGHLRDMPVGTKIKYKTDTADIDLIKDDDGWANAANPDSGHLSPSVLADDIIEGNLYMEAPASVDGPSDALDVQVAPGLPLMSKAQISDAVNALEAHSGFQIAYGFKTIPDHPLAQKDAQNTVKEAAMAAYPDLKPKPAFIAYLKDKGGVSDAPQVDGDSVSKALGDSTAPKIHLGEANPEAKTIQGYNGGDFTADDVEQAIDILEAFGGKAFKAELNKKFNPLGILNPNELVGFNKDKTVTKQKFIDLLKNALAEHKENNPPEAPKPLEQATPAEASKTLKEGDLFDLPVGSVVVTDTGISIEKTGFDAWKSDSAGPVFSTEAVADNFPTLNSKPAEPSPDLPEYATAPAAVQDKTPAPGTEKVKWDAKTAGGAPYAKEAPIGAQVLYKNGNVVLTKVAEDTWRSDEEDYMEASDSYVQGDLNSKQAVVHNNADPEDDLEPWEKELLGSFPDGESAWDGKDENDAPAGSEVITYEKATFYRKNDAGYWEAFYADNGAPKHFSIGPAQMQDLINDGLVKIKTDDDDQEDKDKKEFAVAPDAPDATPQTNTTGLTPGKYSTAGGKAYMVVGADGSGAYVQANGVVKPLSAEKAKKNFDAGMTTYGGLVDMPSPTDPADKPAPAKKVAKGPVVLPEGTYYLGDSTKDNTTVYVVEGQQVKIYKSGSYEQYDYASGTYKPDPTVEAVPLDKIKTAYHQGKIVDKDGNSVVPAGYSGPIVMWNIPTTTQALVQIRKALEDGDDPDLAYPMQSKFRTKLAKMGLTLGSSTLAQKVNKKNPNFAQESGASSYNAAYDTESPWHAAAMDVLTERINASLEGADTSVPESNAAALFEWNQDQHAVLPLEVASMTHSYYDIPGLNAKAKAVSQAFGGGKILYPPTGKYEKDNWLDYFEQGDFKKMYFLEVQAFASKGKSHPAGYLHPGYEGNEETNQIKWAAAVQGEVPAGDEVPGDWSSVAVSKWSVAELDNYLIAAKMQNPEYLTVPEKRQWVQNHKDKNKKATDTLSAKAALAKQNGSPAVAESPVWTDNIVPAKEYDHMFDEGPYPTGDKWKMSPYSVTTSWALDNQSDPDLQKFMKEKFDSQGYNFPPEGTKWTSDNISAYPTEAAVAAYWDAKYEAYQEELNKPVYTKVKLIEGDEAGTHDVWITQDQFGRKYVFKPVDSPDKRWRAEVESMANNLSITWGFRTPSTSIQEIDGEEGLLMTFADHVSSFKGKNGQRVQMASLTDKQVGQVAAEHVLDWILDNDDTHESNLLMGTDGNIVGIDKGRAFFVYGNWSGTSGDEKAHSNANLVYTRLYNDIRSGKVTQEQAQAAYRAAVKAAKRIQNSDDASAEARLREGVASRPKWSPPGYMTHFSHEQAPQNVDQLVESFLERKHNLVAEIESMWDKVFAESPYEKPEIPAKALGEDHFSGWDEAGFIEHVDSTKVWGTSAFHATAAVKTGSSLVWTEKKADGSDSYRGVLKVGKITQEKILSVLKGKTKDNGYGYNTYQSSAIPGFPATNDWKSTISAAAKDASKHVSDKEFDTAVWGNLTNLVQTLEKDREHYDTLVASPPTGSNTTFPSGKTVPNDALPQFRMAIDHYMGLVSKVQNAREEGLTTNKEDFTVYSPTPAKKDGLVYSGPDGEQYVEMLSTGWLHTKPGQSPEVVVSPPQEIKSGQAEGWSDNQKAPSPDTDPVVYKRLSAHDYMGTLAADGTKTVTDKAMTEGHPGYQYEMTLPTGEVITFRNASSTSTAWSQSGRIAFTLGPDAEASLSRVQDHLATLGLDLTGAQEEDAENVYWREMFGRVLLSSGGDSKVKAARDKLQGMQSELKSQTGASSEFFSVHEIVEGIGLTRTPEEERAFWNELAVETWGAAKVSDFLASGAHLPQYPHMNLADPEMNTGMPYFNRLDVDVDELKATGTMIAIGNKGKDNSLLNYITSGGMASTEERMRLLGVYKEGISSSSDQGYGSATGVFTRLAVPGSDAEFTGSAGFGKHVAYWSPDALLQTGTYSFTGDHFGDLNQLQSGNKFNPVQSAKNNTSEANETLVQNTLSIFDYLEIMVFESETKRNEAIQRMKAQGFSTLRGLPIEERLIMRSNLKATLAKVKEQWKK